MSDTPTRPDRSLLIVAVVIATLLALSVTTVLLRGEARLLDSDTPEGTVQRYVAAVLEGDEQTAGRYLTERARQRCEGYLDIREEDLRVTLVSTSLFDGTADVTVAVTATFGAAPFGVSESTSEEVFDLVDTDGTWLIDGVPWRFATVCEEVGS